MIAIIAKLLGGSTLAAWLVVAIAIVAVLTGFGIYERHEGSAATAIVYQAKIDRLVADYATAKANELERQAAANNAAKAREAVRVAEMQAANAALQSQIKELANEADKDPDAGRLVLGATSVQRINKIR